MTTTTKTTSMKILFPLIELFSLIQEYCTDLDYHAFMNSNQKDFQEIKYHTIHYQMTIKYEEENKVKIRKQLERLSILISKVKNKSKQISLRLSRVIPEFLIENISKFTGIRYLYVLFESNFYGNQPTMMNFDFNLFNHISHVKINHLSEIQTISNGFENVRNLEIVAARSLQSIDLHLRTFESISISSSSLSNTGSIVHCRNIVLKYVTLSKQEITFLPEIPYRCITLSECGRFPIGIFDLCNLSSLQKLEITDLDLSGRSHDCLSMFCHIQSLSLHLHHSCLRREEDGDELIDYEFPFIFYGKFLELFHFNLISWRSPEIIPNVKEIKLCFCSHLDPSLFVLSKVRAIYMQKIKFLENEDTDTLVSLPSCIRLNIQSMDQLKRIEYQPKLRYLTLSSCLNLSEYHTLNDGLFLDEVYSGRCSLPYQCFRNARKLIVTADTVMNLRSFHDFSQSERSSPMDREIFIIHAGKYSPHFDCHEISFLKTFLLNAKYATYNLQGIHHIHTVILRGCHEIKELIGLNNIDALQLYDLPSLVLLDGLKDIRVLMIAKVSTECNFIGFKDACETIYSSGNPILDQQAEFYAKGEFSSMVTGFVDCFQNVKEFYFVNAKAISFGWPELSRLSSDGVERLW